MRRLAVGLALVLALAACSDSDEPKSEPGDQAPAAPDGATAEAPDTEVVGLGRVSVEVPKGLHRRVQSCPGEPTAESEARCLTLTADGKGKQPVSLYVRLMPYDEADLGALEAGLQPLTTGSGLEALMGTTCPPSASCALPSGKIVVVPSENFAMVVAGPGEEGVEVAAIVRSVALVPDSYTTVPVIGRGTMNHRAGNLLVASGLRPKVAGASLDFEPGGFSARVPVTSIDPLAGTVVFKGSVVTFRLMPRLLP